MKLRVPNNLFSLCEAMDIYHLCIPHHIPNESTIENSVLAFHPDAYVQIMRGATTTASIYVISMFSVVVKKTLKKTTKCSRNKISKTVILIWNWNESYNKFSTK